MKNVLLLLALVIITTGLAAQEGKTHKPMSRFSYNIYTNRIEKSKNDERRRKKAVRIMKHKYISSNQLYKSALLFTDDEQRLIYVKEVYPRITDKTNAIIVCDAFEKFSHAQILWEYIKENNIKYDVPETDMASYTEYLDMRDRKKDRQKDEVDKDKNKDGDVAVVAPDKDVADDKDKDKTEVVENDAQEITDKTEEVNKTEQPETITGIVFPDALSYAGNKGCDGFLTDKPFQAFLNSVAKFESDDEKAKICMEYVYTYCFNTEQVMKLGMLIETENFRYIFFKTAYEKVYDRDNFLHVKQLLTNPKLKQGINEIYVVPGTTKPYAVADESVEVKCFVSDEDYSKLKSDIKKEMSSTQRLEAAKRLIPEYKCLSANQIEGMLTIFSLEADKIEFAKFCYKYCSDPKNYRTVTGFFTSQASKDEIINYINSLSE